MSMERSMDFTERLANTLGVERVRSIELTVEPGMLATCRVEVLLDDEQMAKVIQLVRMGAWIEKAPEFSLRKCGAKDVTDDELREMRRNLVEIAAELTAAGFECGEKLGDFEAERQHGIALGCSQQHDCHCSLQTLSTSGCQCGGK